MDRKSQTLAKYRKNGFKLRAEDSEFFSDVDFMFEAVRNDQANFDLVSNELRDNDAFIMLIHKHGVRISRQISYRLRNDKTFMKQLLLIDLDNYTALSKELQKDEDLVMLAIMRDPTLFSITDDKFRKDKDFVRKVIKKNKTLAKFADEVVKDDVVIRAVINKIMPISPPISLMIRDIGTMCEFSFDFDNI